MPPKRIRLEEIVFFKAFCILAVLAVHSTSQAEVSLPPHSLLYELIHWTNRFFKFGTPLFLFISAFIYFHAYLRPDSGVFNWRKFAKSRVSFVLTPFLIFSTFYYVLKSIVYPVDRSVWEWLTGYLLAVISGKAHTHLYYILVVMQFYLIFALMVKPVNRMRMILKYLFPASLVVHIVFLMLNHEFQWIQAKGSLFISYLSYFSLGAWTGANYAELLAWWEQQEKRIRMVLLSALGGAALAGMIAFTMLWDRQYAKFYSQNSLWIEYSGLLYALPMCILMLLLARKFIPRNGYLTRFLRQTGEVSFGLYLIHPMFLMGYRAIPMNPGIHRPLSYLLWVSGGFVFALCGSGILVYALRKWLTRFASYSIGIAPPKPVVMEKNNDHAA